MTIKNIIISKEFIKSAIPDISIDQNLFLSYDNDLLKFSCVICGNCCDQSLIQDNSKNKTMVVPLSSFDLDRFMTGSEINNLFIPLHLIHEYTIENENMVILPKHNKRCLFLKKDLYCEIYSLRPNVCSLYPYEIYQDKYSPILELRIKTNNVCPPEAFESNVTPSEDEIRLMALKFIQISEGKNATISQLKEIHSSIKIDDKNLSLGTDIFNKIFSDSFDRKESFLKNSVTLDFYFIYSSLGSYQQFQHDSRSLVLEHVLNDDNSFIINSRNPEKASILKISLTKYELLVGIILGVGWVNNDKFSELSQIPMSLLYTMIQQQKNNAKNEEQNAFLQDFIIQERIIQL